MLPPSAVAEAIPVRLDRGASANTGRPDVRHDQRLVAGVTLRMHGDQLDRTREAEALAEALWEDGARGAASVAVQIGEELKQSPAFARGIDLTERGAVAVHRILDVR
jgi:hypothetical protein